ncbi:hypothetical protein ACJU26_05790 [Acidithiobacillus sp. M4-SHS-6]|uniref:hypothetical protein n=1 Tax=Acidithiobacillus sp. M4-SHS-6 TaxID=3383024 RepID=UPI0039BE4072
MSYQAGYEDGKRAARPRYDPAANYRAALYQRQVNEAFQNQANQYQNLLTRFENLVDDYNNLVERYNLRGEALQHSENALQHSENALQHEEKAHQHAKNAHWIAKRMWMYQEAALTALINIPGLALTKEPTDGFGPALREAIEDLQKIDNSEETYQDLIEYIGGMSRNIADKAILKPYFHNELKLLQLSPRDSDLALKIRTLLSNRMQMRASTNNPLPYNWPDRPAQLREVMDASAYVTDTTFEHRFMERFYQILTRRALVAIFGHMNQGKDCTEPEPVAAALADARQSDVFPFFPENRQARFGETLQTIMVDASGNPTGISYENWLRSSFGQVLNAMDEWYLFRQNGTSTDLSQLIPQAVNLDVPTATPPSEMPVKKVVNGGWGSENHAPAQASPVNPANPSPKSPGWGEQPAGTWGAPPPPVEKQPSSGDSHKKPSSDGKNPPRYTWGGGPS